MAIYVDHVTCIIRSGLVHGGTATRETWTSRRQNGRGRNNCRLSECPYWLFKNSPKFESLTPLGPSGRRLLWLGQSNRDPSQNPKRQFCQRPHWRCQTPQNLATSRTLPLQIAADTVHRGDTTTIAVRSKSRSPISTDDALSVGVLIIAGRPLWAPE